MADARRSLFSGKRLADDDDDDDDVDSPMPKKQRAAYTDMAPCSTDEVNTFEDIFIRQTMKFISLKE